MKTVINIKNRLNGTNSYDDGHILYCLCVAEFRYGNEVDVNLEGSLGWSSSFLNGFLLPLIKQFGKEAVKSKLSFSNLKQGHHMVISRYLESLNPNHQPNSIV
jgi:hypothetical protein